MNKTDFGKFGEEKGIEFLKKKGYKILTKNFRTKLGEIDIIAKKDKKIVFIEVKTRRNSEFGFPEESVNRKKLLRIERCAHIYLTRNKIDCDYRFEILSILLKENPEFNIIPIE